MPSGVTVDFGGSSITSNTTFDDNTFDAAMGNRIDLVTDAYQQGVADGQGQWQPDRETGAATRLRVDIYRAAELLDLGEHDIHADAAPRDL